MLKPELCWQQWEKIGASPTIVNWIQEGVPLAFHSEPAAFDLSNHPLTSDQEKFVDAEINELVACGIIKCCSYKPICISPIGCVPKKSSYRLIVDLRQVNKYCDCSKLSYEDINTVKQLVKPHDSLIVADIKSGYHHVKVSEEYQKYLGIRWRGKLYVWTRLPFGLSLSAYYFVKVVRAVIAHLRSEGLRIVCYVDDFLLMSDENNICQDKQLLLSTLESLGLTINVEKSILEPTTEIQYIGYTISTVNSDNLLWLFIPKSRVKKLRHDISRALRSGKISARGLARIAGQCVSMIKAILPGKLLLRNVYRLLKTRKTWQDTLVLDQGTIQDLNWWKEAPNHWNGLPIQDKPVDAQMTTDASSWGWGCQMGELQAQGIWTSSIAMKSSNYRELLTVLMALMSLKKHIQGKVLQILSDNVTTVCYVNMQGGPSKELTQVATAIWAFALENDITMFARHLSGSENTAADSLSRLSAAYEWQMHQQVFQYIDRIWGPHTMDRFASVTTALLPQYNSRFHDPMTAGVDALAQKDWAQHMNFVNPPFRMLPQVLSKILAHQAEATVIAPMWRAQPWLNVMQRMAIAPPLKLPQPRKLCIPVHPKFIPEPCKNPKWRLFAWRLSGKHAC